jgi:Anti-sigma factor NepR
MEPERGEAMDVSAIGRVPPDAATVVGIAIQLISCQTKSTGHVRSEAGGSVFPSTYKPLDLIGAHLREAWSDVVSAPLPDNLRSLVEALSRAQNTTPQVTAGPVPRRRSGSTHEA